LLIATPNITVDRTVRLAELRPGSVLRPYGAVTTAGGKGLNVARVTAAFGHRATLVGFAPETDAAVLRRLFGAEPVDLVGVPVAGEARVATIYLEDSGRVTVLNEPGPTIPDDAWRRYEEAIAGELAGGRHTTLVCSGSLPPGVPDDAYGRLVGLGRRAGVRVVVDAARAALAGALGAGPDTVTPNLAEAEGVLQGHEEEPVAEAAADVPLRACAAVRELCRRGARTAAVTAGAAGTAYGDARDVVWVPTVEVRVVNPIGAGDAFVGGLVEALDAGLSGRERWSGLSGRERWSGRAGVDAVVFAVATATASVEQELAGGVDPERARRLVERLAGTARTERDLVADAAARTGA
jgi:1-phosphofructokinase family hexose kinase